MKELMNLSAASPRMTIRTLAALKAIKDYEGLSIRKLSDLMGISERCLFKTIERLEDGRAGNLGVQLVRSEPDPWDSRSRSIYITTEGLKVLDGVRNALNS